MSLVLKGRFQIFRWRKTFQVERGTNVKTQKLRRAVDKWETGSPPGRSIAVERSTAAEKIPGRTFGSRWQRAFSASLSHGPHPSTINMIRKSFCQESRGWINLLVGLLMEAG